jgi:hypothetical protein
MRCLKHCGYGTVTDHVLETAQESLERGRAAVSRAGDAALTDPEGELRSALVAFRRAMDWFEAAGDDAGFDTAHNELHEAGHEVRTRFGCSLEQENGRYFIVCPADLAHTRIGLSMNAISRRIECTVCDQEISACPHIKGREYDGVTCYHRIMDLDVRSVDLVPRPAHPDARVVKESVDVADLVESLGSDFEPGMPVSCDQCLMECRGIQRPLDRPPTVAPTR